MGRVFELDFGTRDRAAIGYPLNRCSTRRPVINRTLTRRLLAQRLPGIMPPTPKEAVITMDLNERDKLIIDWQEADEKRIKALAAELELRNKCFAFLFPNAEVGTNTYELGKGYEVKGVRKLNYNLANGQGQTEAALDEIAKLGNEGQFIAERLVGWTPKLSLYEYKKLEPDNNPTHKRIKEIIDGVLTITDGTPTLEVKKPKAK